MQKNTYPVAVNPLKQGQPVPPKNAREIYAGRVDPNISIHDNYELIRLNAIDYLQEKCSVEMPFNQKTGYSKGFDFLTAPEHAELQKLNGIKFHVNKMLIEEYISRKKIKPRKN